MRIKEIAQQAAQAVGAQGLGGQMAVEVQVQARHVDAAHVGAMQVDEGLDAGRYGDRLGASGSDADGGFDFAHAHPSELARRCGSGVVGDVRHDADDVFAGRGHGGSGR